jgi:hypothetical protein
MVDSAAPPHQGSSKGWRLLPSSIPHRHVPSQSDVLVAFTSTDEQFNPHDEIDFYELK